MIVKIEENKSQTIVEAEGYVYFVSQIFSVSEDDLISVREEYENKKISPEENPLLVPQLAEKIKEQTGQAKSDFLSSIEKSLSDVEVEELAVSQVFNPHDNWAKINFKIKVRGDSIAEELRGKIQSALDLALEDELLDDEKSEVEIKSFGFHLHQVPDGVIGLSRE